MSNFTLSTFKGGRDVRLGQFAGKHKDRFKVLTNYFSDKDGHLRRRPPVKQLSGTLSANAQGLVILNGNLVQIAKKGDVVTNTIVGATITTLRFDNPDYCTTWQLIQAIVYNGSVVATIRHTYPGGTVTSRIFLHVFDGSTTKPTYVEDAFCPTSWAPTLPLHVYQQGAPGAFLDYTPRMCVAAEKLHMSGPDGNLYFSRVKNARAWNTFSQQEMIDYGEWWYFVTNTTVGLQNFIVSDDYNKLFAAGGWTCFVLEYQDSAGNWIEFIEDTVPPVADKIYQPQSIAGRFAGVANEINLAVYWTGGAGTIIRFRLIVGAPALSFPGTNVISHAFNYNERFNGNGATLVFPTVGICNPVAAGSAVVVDPEVWVGGALIPKFGNWTVSYATGVAVVTFVVAPPVGVNNVVIFAPSNFYQPTVVPPVTYYIDALLEGVHTQAASPFGTIQPANSTWVFGIGIVYDTATALPTGQTRYGSLALRKVTTANVTPPITILTSEVFHYGYEAGYESAFFLQKKAFYLKMAGFGEAGFLATQSKNNGGGLIIDLSAVGSTVIVYYPTQSQLWTIHTDQLLNSSADDTGAGSGQHSGGVTVKFGAESLVFTDRGLRLFGAGNFNNDNLEDNNIGEAIEEFHGYSLTAGCFWAYTGELVCAMDNGAATELHVFDYSKNSKISSWSKWESSALGRIASSGLLPVNGRLYYTTLAGEMFYFDADATDRQYDLAATPYTSTVQWPLLDMDQPGLEKVFEGFGLAAIGTWSVAFTLLTNDTEIEVPGPVGEGSTYGKGMIDLSMEGQALGLIIRSTGAPTDSGIKDSVIQAVQIDYNLVRR